MSIEEDRKMSVGRYAILLADELSIGEAQLRKILEHAFKIKDKQEAFAYLSDALWALVEEVAAEIVKVAEWKEGEVLPAIFVASYLAKRKAGLKAKIYTYSTQFLREVDKASVMSKFYSPKINAKLLTTARIAAGLPITAKSSITNMKVLVNTLITDLFNSADVFLMSGNGAIGYIGVRQSTYDCPHCDSLCGYLIPITEQVFPAHPRCVCSMIPVYSKDL